MNTDNMNFFVLLHSEDHDTLPRIEDIPDTIRNNSKEWELGEGVAVKQWFPENAIFSLSEDFGSELTDSIPNVSNLLFVSEQLKSFMEDHSEANIEFLPIKIQDQEDKPIEESYYLMNLLEVVDCIDLEKSEYSVSAVDPSSILFLDLLVLDKTRISDKNKIFRLKGKPELIIIREDLAQAIIESKYTGMMLVDLEEFNNSGLGFMF